MSSSGGSWLPHPPPGLHAHAARGAQGGPTQLSSEGAGRGAQDASRPANARLPHPRTHEAVWAWIVACLALGCWHFWRAEGVGTDCRIACGASMLCSLATCSSWLTSWNSTWNSSSRANCAHHGPRAPRSFAPTAPSARRAQARGTGTGLKENGCVLPPFWVFGHLQEAV